MTTVLPSLLAFFVSIWIKAAAMKLFYLPSDLFLSNFSSLIEIPIKVLIFLRLQFDYISFAF
jgi:hypothetical protein